MTIETQSGPSPVKRCVVRGRKLNRVCGIEMPRLIDARSSAARLFKRLVVACVAEMGGESALSDLDRIEVATLCTLEVKLADLRKAVLDGQDTQSDELVRLSSEIRRVRSRLKAKAAQNKPAAPSLAEYLANRSNTEAGPA